MHPRRPRLPHHVGSGVGLQLGMWFNKKQICVSTIGFSTKEGAPGACLVLSVPKWDGWARFCRRVCAMCGVYSTGVSSPGKARTFVTYTSCRRGMESNTRTTITLGDGCLTLDSKLMAGHLAMTSV